MQPDAGGRLEALLIHQDETGARFRVQLSTAAGVWVSEASVSLATGEIAGAPWTGPGEPPDWLCRYLRSALRAGWRGRAEDGWPRRITRWRDAPDPRRAREPDEGG